MLSRFSQFFFTLFIFFTGCEGFKEEFSLDVYLREDKLVISPRKNRESFDYRVEFCIYIEGMGKICPSSEINLKTNYFQENIYLLEWEKDNFLFSLNLVKGIDNVLIHGSIKNSKGSFTLQCITLELIPLFSSKVQYFFHEGYQSWSPAFVFDDFPFDEGLSDSYELGSEGDFAFAHPFQSWWIGGVQMEKISLVGGAVNSKTFRTKVFLKRNGGMKIVNGCTEGESKRILSGERFSGDVFSLILHKNLFSALERYGQLLRENNPVSPPPFIPSGWNSWNTFFGEINAGLIFEQMDVLISSKFNERLKVIQIDDGWEREWGDWDGKEEFLGTFKDMKEIVDEIKKRGKVPGIWFAPFLYHTSLRNQTENPDWFLKNERGEFIRYGPYLVLDITHPFAESFFRSTVRKIRDWGFRYFKVDFLFAGGMAGRRYGELTSVEAYRKAMEILNEEAGEGIYILGCGAPLLPSAGFFHGMRIGPDIALQGIPFSYPFVKNEFRNVFLRTFWNYVFAGDPDTVLLRNLSIEESILFLTASLLSGKIFALGDDLRKKELGKWALLEKVLLSDIFLPLINKDTPFPLPHSFFLQPGGSPAGDVLTSYLTPWKYFVPEIIWAEDKGRKILALFNWDERRKEISLDLKEKGICEKNCRGQEFWTERNFNGNILRALLEPHSAELWLIHEER